MPRIRLSPLWRLRTTASFRTPCDTRRELWEGRLAGHLQEELLVLSLFGDVLAALAVRRRRAAAIQVMGAQPATVHDDVVEVVEILLQVDDGLEGALRNPLGPLAAAGQVARRADRRLPAVRDGRTTPPSAQLVDVVTAAHVLAPVSGLV